MKKLLAIKLPSLLKGHRVKSQIDKIKKVITQLKEGEPTEKDVNEIRERLYNSLEDGCLNLSECQISDKNLKYILPLLSVLNIKKLNQYMKNSTIDITVKLNIGKFNHTVYGNDLTFEYLKINADYRS